MLICLFTNSLAPHSLAVSFGVLSKFFRSLLEGLTARREKARQRISKNVIHKLLLQPIGSFRMHLDMEMINMGFGVS